MDRPNFYLLLDLDCTESDPGRIEVAICKKQKEWSRDCNHPTRGLQAKQNLEMLKFVRPVMSDPVRRAEEAKECARIRKETQKEMQKKAARELDEEIGILVVEGHLWEQDVANLAQRFKGRFTEQEIRLRIQVPIWTGGKTGTPTKPTIDKSLFKVVTDKLKIVGKKDLYDFLGLRRNASLAALAEKARQEDAETRKYNEKSAEVTARQELAGYCVRFFMDADERQKYDNALDRQGLIELDPLIESAGSCGEIQAERMDKLLRKARERGLSVDEARAHIVAFAKSRKWSVQVPESIQASEMQRCACGVLSPGSAATCGACGDPLTVHCPKCKVPNPSENRACSKCGFPVGDAGLVRRLIRDADLALARGEAEGELRLLKEAQVYWPGATEVDERLAKVKERQNTEAKTYKQIVETIADRRLQKAQKLLTEFREIVPTHPELAKLQEEIDSGIRSAMQCVARARSFEKAGQIDEVGGAYAEAARECRDLREAQDGLSRFPPLAPCNLQAIASTNAVSLNWQSSPSRGPLQYCIVRKIGSEPQTPLDGAVVGETAANKLTDSDAPPGEPVYYAAFANRGGVDSLTPAFTGPIIVTPTPVPDPVTDLACTKRGSQFEATWTPPSRGAVQVHDLHGRRAPACGKVLSTADLESLGKSVPRVGPNLARGDIDGRNVLCLVPVTVNGSLAVVGRSVSMSCIDDVEEVSATFHDGTLGARWKWPPGIDKAWVVLRSDRFPVGPEDAEATRDLYTRTQYEEKGGFRRPWPATCDQVYLTVYASEGGGEHWIYASGSTSDARSEVAIGRRRTVKYRLRAVYGCLGLGKTSQYELSLSPDAETELPALVLVAKPGGRPLSPRGGKRVLITPRGAYCSPRQPLRMTFSPDGLQGRNGVWLFPEDDSECHWLDLVPEAADGYWIS